MNEDQALKTFIIYARDDKEYKNQLLRHLKPLIKNSYLDVWHDGDILPGEDWEKNIKDNLMASELVLVLVSVNCLNSDFIEGGELGRAVERLHNGHTRIVPIIISPCIWRVHKIFNGLQGLPEDMKPVSNWPNQDTAWTNVAESLMGIVEEARAEKAAVVIKQQELAEKQRLQELAAAEASRQKAEQGERDRAAQAQKEREAEDRKRHEEEQNKRLSAEAAQKDKAERQYREKQAEMFRIENQAWEAALETNTVDAFESFAAKYPQNPNARTARQQIKVIRQRERSSSQNTGGSGNKRLIFIGLGTVLTITLAIWLWPKQHDLQQGGLVPDNKEKEAKPAPDLEPAAWSQAQTVNTLSAYRAYLNQYPNGSNTELAKRRIGEIKASAQNYLDDAERLIKNGKYTPARPILRKILDELDPENARAKELWGRMPKE